MAVAVAAAAGIVVGVVYATRQDPAQPTAQCKKRPAIVVPGVRSDHVPAVRAALRKAPAAAARALESVAQQNPGDPVVQFNDGTALLCAGYLAEGAQALVKAKKAGRDTYYEVAADNLPAVLPERLPAVRLQRTERPARPGPGRPARLPPALGRAPLAARRRVAAVGSRRPGRRRGRSLRHGQPVRVVLAARAAREAVSAQPDGPIPPRAAARLDGPALARGERVQGGAGARPGHAARTGCGYLSPGARDKWD